MRTNQNVARLKINATEFGISPALAWLMQAQPLWDEIKRVAVSTNREAAIPLKDLDVPIDRLRFELLSLAAILDERRG